MMLQHCRHPREGGDPATCKQAATLGDSHWIPAFAGMTGVMGEAIVGNARCSCSGGAQ
jgi:hypothetical protein